MMDYYSTDLLFKPLDNKNFTHMFLIPNSQCTCIWILLVRPISYLVLQLSVLKVVFLAECYCSLISFYCFVVIQRM